MVTRGKASELLAYVAGVVDSDGHIGIDKSLTNPQRRVSPRYQPTVCVVNTSEALMTLLQSEFGGSVNTRKKVAEHHKTTYRWKLCNRMAADFCRQIAPYLLVKKAQSELLVEMMDAIPLYANTRLGHKTTPPEDLARREAVYQRFKALNDDRRYPQRLSGAASRTDEAIV